MRDAIERADQLLNELGDQPVATMAYATACAARLTTDGGERVFPRALSWLRHHQHGDGSWGGAVPNSYDRLVSTLAALLALCESERDWAVPAVRAGMDYLRRNAREWRGEHGEPIGFEVVAPHLVEQAEAAGLVSADYQADLVRLRDEKLAHLPPGALEREATGLLYSLEALGCIIPLAPMARFQAANGSMANNPPATGALWACTRGAAAFDYLRSAARSTGDGGMPEIYPISVFEPAWVLYLLHRGGLASPSSGRHAERLAKLASHAETGLGVSEEFPVPDSDDTAMVANVLHAFGYDPEPLLRALLCFETDDHFIGFQHERGTPVSANARVLEAFTLCPERFAAQIRKATAFLVDARQEGAWWYDKWHLSRYYATAQVAFGLVRTMPEALAGTWRWLLDSQHRNGSWGIGDGQPEETAYAVLALDALEPRFGPLPAETFRRANAYLRQHIDAADYAELWIGKGLYTPCTVVRAAVLTAGALTREGSR